MYSIFVRSTAYWSTTRYDNKTEQVHERRLGAQAEEADIDTTHDAKHASAGLNANGAKSWVYRYRIREETMIS